MKIKDLTKVIITYCTKLRYNVFMFKILRKISFRYKVYTSFIYTTLLSDILVTLTFKLKRIYGETKIELIPYVEGKYAKIKYKEISISKNEVRCIIDKYDKSYFKDVGIKMTKNYIKLYINFNC